MHWLPTVTRKRRLLRSPSDSAHGSSFKHVRLELLPRKKNVAWYRLTPMNHWMMVHLFFHHGLLSKLYAFCAASHSIHLQSLGFVLMIEARKSTDLVKEVNHIIQWPHDVPACALHMFALLMPFCCWVSQKGFTLFAMSCSRKVVFYVFL
jgi:hypothetical protein